MLNTITPSPSSQHRMRRVWFLDKQGRMRYRWMSPTAPAPVRRRPSLKRVGRCVACNRSLRSHFNVNNTWKGCAN